MNVGILGLGLIGGSMARCFARAGHTVYAREKDESVFSFARLAGAIHGALDEETLPLCDFVMLAIYPGGCVDYLKENAHRISKDALVMDLCGIKEEICEQGFALAKAHGFTFVGGHPMAGSHFSGFKYSRSNLFQGAPMVLVPPVRDDMEILQRVKDIMIPCGFGSFSVCTAREHDKRIAFTSQMPHIVSNAFIKSPTALDHTGFSAGSYRDMTRVAWLNAKMWAELCMENKENVLFELDTYIESLKAYRAALQAGDTAALTALLDEGRKRKEEVDG